MKRVTRSAAALLERGGTTLDRARSTEGLTILGYHRLDDSESDLSVRPDHFRAHLDRIEAEGYAVVGLDQVASLARDRRRMVAFTFDDGYRSVAETAWPMLKARRWPATIYAVSGYLDGSQTFPWDAGAQRGAARLMDASIVRELAAEGVTVGSHSVSHRYLPGLSPREARSEIDDSRRALEDLLGSEVSTFSYPMGGWNRSLRAAVRSAGYSTAVTCVRGINTATHDPLALRRPIVESDPEDFARILNGFFDFLRPLDWARERWRQRQARTS